MKINHLSDTQTVIHSALDVSINLVKRKTGSDPKDMIESRIVQRDKDTIIIYLSTHNGCKNACRFCHLTQSGQTLHDSIGLKDLWEQVSWVKDTLEHDPRLKDITTCHINLMARGDALSSDFMMYGLGTHRHYIKNILNPIFPNKVFYKFKISTIFPKDCSIAITSKAMKYWLKYTAFTEGDTEIYYSLYSLNEKFRKRWLPLAASPDDVGELFRGTYSSQSHIFRLHYALIKNQNDSIQDAEDICDWLKKYDISTNINLVRYNPYDISCGEESDESTIQKYADKLAQSPHVNTVQVVTRVGTDCKASCGTFIEPSFFDGVPF